MFTGLLRRSKSAEESSANETETIEREEYLKALEQLRISSQVEYRCVLEYFRQQLERARRVSMFTAAHPRDYIANVAIAKDVKIRTLATVVDDMERTVDKLAAREPEEDAEIIPIGV